jgi:hypothetical protein
MGKLNEFYIHLESSLKLNSELMSQIIKEEEIYSKFKDEDRFLSLLLKYGIYLDNFNN